jgi:hypothetical protein
MTRTVRLLVPTATSVPETTDLAARPAVVRTLAFLHNGQPQYDVLAADVLAALKGRAHLIVREYRKPGYGNAADPAMLDEIASMADAALVGLAC